MHLTAACLSNIECQDLIVELLDEDIVGFDDLYVSRFFSPALTTIRVDQLQMGEIGAGILLDSLTDESHVPCKRIVQTRLVVRDTVKEIKS